MTNKTVQQAPKKMSTSLKAALIVIPVVVLAIAIAIFVYVQNSKAAIDESPTGEGGGDAVPLVLENSHVMNDAGEGAPVLVEFLDFECEACGAVYPVIENVRAQYDGQLTYVMRYFITNHANSMNAALAAEAASEQGKFEEMFHTLFERQAEWGEQQEPQSDVFRGYAEELGLDMAAYDKAVANPATEERIMIDHNAGIKLGVRGTPTFLLDGEQLQLQYVSDLTDAIDAAIAKRD